MLKGMAQKHSSPEIQPMLIKRYAGRRLYNTVSLTYASRDDLAAMAMKGIRFVVRDADTGEDVTSDILNRPN
jgi:polyhydroxyalkanoate synthesis regulator protein